MTLNELINIDTTHYYIILISGLDRTCSERLVIFSLKSYCYIRRTVREVNHQYIE